MKFLLTFLIIFLIIFLIYYIIKFKHPKIETLNLVSGGLGSGKTSVGLVCRPITILRKFYFLWRNKKIKNDYIILSSFPIGIKENNSNKRYIKIFGKKIYCYDLTLDILTMKTKLPQDEVILLCDEFSSIANQFDFGNPIIKNNIDEFISKFRHYTNDKGYIFIADQCSQNIFLQVRRRANIVYNMIETRKIKFLPIIINKYRRIYISDEVQNMIDVESANNYEDIRKCLYFINPFKYYDSCYLSQRYQIISKIEELKNNNLTLKRNDVMKLTLRKKQYYECLFYDGIKEEDYN